VHLPGGLLDAVSGDHDGHRRGPYSGQPRAVEPATPDTEGSGSSRAAVSLYSRTALR
jgi:hypothetical protein